MDEEGYKHLQTFLPKRSAITLKALPTSQAHAEQQERYVRAKAFESRAELERLLKCGPESIEDREEAPSVKEVAVSRLFSF